MDQDKIFAHERTVEICARLAEKLIIFRYADPKGAAHAYAIIKGTPFHDRADVPQAHPPQAPAEEADSQTETTFPNVCTGESFQNTQRKPPADSTKEAAQPNNFMQQGYRPEHNPLKQPKDI